MQRQDDYEVMRKFRLRGSSNIWSMSEGVLKVRFNERVKSEGDFPPSSSHNFTFYHLLTLDRIRGDGGLPTEDATLIFCAVLIKTSRLIFSPFNMPKNTENISSTSSRMQ